MEFVTAELSGSEIGWETNEIPTVWSALFFLQTSTLHLQLFQRASSSHVLRSHTYITYFLGHASYLFGAISSVPYFRSIREVGAEP